MNQQAQLNGVSIGETYVFTKSGNTVRVIARAGQYAGKPMMEVERTDGASRGKRMDVPAEALVKTLE